MMTKFYFSALLLCFFIPFSFTQISIDSDDFLGLIGSTFVTETDSSGSVTVDVGMPGANQSWDLSDVQMTNPFVINIEFLDPNNTPYGARFAEANLAEKLTTPEFPQGAFYNFLAVSDERVRQVGDAQVANIGGMDFEQISDDNALVASFPITVGSGWSETIYDTTTQQGLVTNIFFDSTVIMVDGWGTLKLPHGDFQCLRLFEQCWTRTETIINGVSTGITSESALSYIWVSDKNYILATVTSQDGETDPNFTDAAFFDRQSGGTTPVSYTFQNEYPIEVMTANPFQESVTLSFTLPTGDPAQLSIFDLQGRLLQSIWQNDQPLKSNQVTWHVPSAVSNGTYLAVLEQSGNRSTKKLQILK